MQDLVSSVKAHNDADLGFAHSSEAALKNFDDTSINPAMRDSYALAMWERMIDMPYGKKRPLDQAAAYMRDQETVTENFGAHFAPDAPAQLNINGFHEPNFKEIYWGAETYEFLLATK